MLDDLPPVNATLNAISLVLLLAGWYAVRTGAVERHKRLMLVAFTTSTLFLISYVFHRIRNEHVPFTHDGWPRAVYYFILITHIPLAILMVPPILVLLVHALRGRIDRHRRLARVVLPVWVYVNVTGVLVYLMLYQWFPAA